MRSTEAVQYCIVAVDAAKYVNTAFIFYKLMRKVKRPIRI